jgi:hypothetical protein
MQRHLSFILIVLLFTACGIDSTQEEPSSVAIADPGGKQILMMGTFHYNNPGADVVQVKSFDILSDSAQEELEVITDRIKRFAPSQIFVEWKYDRQEKLDSLYALYLSGNYFDNEELSDFYRKNEIFQMAFRAGEKLGLKRIVAVDYPYTDFPYGDMMSSIEKAGQSDLEESFTVLIQEFTVGFDELITSGATLEEMYSYLNSQELRQLDLGFYTHLATQAGSVDDFDGPLLSSEWFKRNLCTWSLIQKGTLPEDERVMILLGSSHVAMIDLFLKGNKEWTPVELSEI